MPRGGSFVSFFRGVRATIFHGQDLSGFPRLAVSGAAPMKAGVFGLPAKNPQKK
jgi:hypothetical protein